MTEALNACGCSPARSADAPTVFDDRFTPAHTCPNQRDKTFGPQIVYQKAPTKEEGQGLAPSYRLQFFGHVSIDGASEIMTVTLNDVHDNALWSTTVEPVKT